MGRESSSSSRDSAVMAPHDVRMSHEGMVSCVCWICRSAMFFGVFGSLFHVALFVLGHAADLRIALVKLTGALSIVAVSVFAIRTGRPHVWEVRKIFVALCTSQVVFSMFVCFASVKWTTHDIVVMVVTRPLLSLLAMCIHTVLEVVGQAEPDRLLIGTCTAINAAVIAKTYSDMPSLIGVAISAVIVQLCVAKMLKDTVAVLLMERDALKLARDCLQQHLDSQDSMWRSVFDATFLCDLDGRISRASPQAADLFLAASPEALGGERLRSLSASKEEAERLETFARDVVSSSTSQAMTIQGTFLRSDGSSVELQVNAVRIAQRLSDPASTGTFGILFGMRVVESAAEEVTRAEPANNHDSSARAEGESDDLWIAFDAGTENFEIMDMSPELCPEESRRGLSTWFPPLARAALEEWVVGEVASCGKDGKASSDVVERFQLRMPAVPARSISADRAWLEVRPTEAYEDGELSLPAVLWLRGASSGARGGEAASAASARRAGAAQHGGPRLDIIPESACDAEEQGSESPSSLKSEDLAPSDSVSMAGLRFRMRVETTRDGEGAGPAPPPAPGTPCRSPDRGGDSPDAAAPFLLGRHVPEPLMQALPSTNCSSDHEV